MAFGEIVVSMEKEEPFSDFIIRTFTISKVRLLFKKNLACNTWFLSPIHGFFL